MADFPVPLDNLITYVKALHPDGARSTTSATP
jgi:hypothetical protein